MEFIGFSVILSGRLFTASEIATSAPFVLMMGVGRRGSGSGSSSGSGSGSGLGEGGATSGLLQERRTTKRLYMSV